MNCPSCNFKTGVLGVMLDQTTVVKNAEKEGDIYVCPMCDVVSFIHGDKLCPPTEVQQQFLERNKDMIARVRQLYRDHKKTKAN